MLSVTSGFVLFGGVSSPLLSLPMNPPVSSDFSASAVLTGPLLIHYVFKKKFLQT
jgi:hypothetical protein